jgi:hypothetical protein
LTATCGSVGFVHRGLRRTATLAVDRTWSVRPPLPEGIERTILDALLADVTALDHGPSDGPFGPSTLAAVADRMRALGYRSVTLRPAPSKPRPAPPPDLVY